MIVPAAVTIFIKAVVVAITRLPAKKEAAMIALLDRCFAAFYPIAY
ncbi:hypothetical protein [Endozoicomonas euniceicola]|uniref:Uncharacterized protein n=1 Tax=Endozoicomonas euniceicola TaxID=1234143 RepID=A0ABY6GWB4_9GAMM|nr:hypothetical protein [Endozoicomonas euniceicola]UYM17062.1 hypothetical protein NX720_03800 [Endozoicomonas euniceicola]